MNCVPGTKTDRDPPCWNTIHPYETHSNCERRNRSHQLSMLQWCSWPLTISETSSFFFWFIWIAVAQSQFLLVVPPVDLSILYIVFICSTSRVDKIVSDDLFCALDFCSLFRSRATCDGKWEIFPQCFGEYPTKFSKKRCRGQADLLWTDAAVYCVTQWSPGSLSLPLTFILRQFTWPFRYRHLGRVLCASPC